MGWGCKKNIDNYHIERIVQDVQASSGLEEFFNHFHELHGVNSQRNQGCAHISRWCSNIWNNKTNDQYEKQMLAVKSRLRDSKFTINEKNSTLMILNRWFSWLLCFKRRNSNHSLTTCKNQNFKTTFKYKTNIVFFRTVEFLKTNDTRFCYTNVTIE